VLDKFALDPESDDCSILPGGVLELLAEQGLPLDEKAQHSGLSILRCSPTYTIPGLCDFCSSFLNLDHFLFGLLFHASFRLFGSHTVGTYRGLSRLRYHVVAEGLV